ncbi:MAG: DUF3488 domain-containing protein [Planctomycetaceae bacterium]|nr:DUF3488 domain-containing protein [Planctomycetaceae bacterium]
MNRARRRVQILIMSMLMLNGLLLVLSRGEAWPLALLIVLPIPVWYVVDHKRWYELPTWAANTIGLGIGAYAMYFFWFLATERHLAIVSDMVCYLLLTMMLQEKSPRLYWQITVLSVLQSVVASVFSLDLQQGVIFIFYTLIVLMALASIVRFRDELVATLRMDRFNNMIDPSVHQLRQYGAPIVLQPNKLSTADSRVGALYFAISVLAFFTVATGMLIYVTIPRLEESAESNLLRLKTTGISRQIKSLEPSGVLLPNSAEAFRVKIVDPAGGKTVRLNEDLYLRGACLEKLESEETGWRTYQDSVPSLRQLSFPAFPGKTLLQEIVMVPREDPMLFYALPATPTMNATREVLFDTRSEMLKRFSATGTVAATPFRYEVGLYGVEQGQLPDLFPFLNYSSNNFDQPLNADFRGRYTALTEFDPQKYSRIAEKAQEIANTVGNPLNNRREICKALEDYLANSGEFQYTTDFRNIVRNRELDPVEDFVANYRQGHCELYASALCLMLRSLEIPARVVVGYRTAYYNDVAGHYLVQEKHAHSWVEAYLPPLSLTDLKSLKDKGLAGDGGAWLRLDATPAAAILNEDSDLFTQANNALDFAQSLWDEYVMGIQETGEVQEKKSFGAEFLQSLLDPTALVQIARSRLESMSVWQRAGLAGVILIGLVLIQQRIAKRKKTVFSGEASQTRSFLRRLLGQTTRAIDGQLGPHWADDLMIRLEKLAIAGGFSPRKPSMTALEFAGQWIKEIETSVRDPKGSNLATAHAQVPQGAGPSVVGSATDWSVLLRQLKSEIQSLVSEYYQVKYSNTSGDASAAEPKSVLNRWTGRLATLQKGMPKRSVKPVEVQGR